MGRVRARAMVLAAGPLNERPVGPEIRALEFAKALGPDFDVTLVAKRRDPTTREGIRVLPARRSVILAEATRTDVVISPSLPPYLLAVKPMLGFAAVADQYDPHELELATLDGSQRTRELRRRFAFRTLQLRQADLVLCAGVRQRQASINAALDQTVRGRPLQIDPVVIPFGISQAPPPTGRRPLREHFPAIGEDDKVVIWWGTVWRWFDAETAIRAFAEISGQRSDVKLVITAGKPPNKNASRFEATKGAMALARELGVADRAVFFLDEWIPYESRYDYLREAELGLTLHRSEQEAELAARARYMDYLSVGLPCVLGRGDEVADDFERASYATLVDRPTPQALASTLLDLLDNPEGLARRKEAGIRLASQRQWSAVGLQLRSALESIPAGRSFDVRTMSGNLARTMSYYGLRAADLVAEAID